MEANVILLVVGVVTIAATIYVMWLVPDALARLVLWMLTHTFYRVRVLGRENIPEKGGALLVSEPPFDGGRAVFDRLDGPAYPLHHEPRAV